MYMIYMARSHGIIRFYWSMFSLTLTLCLPNTIRRWRIDVHRASKFLKCAEICTYLGTRLKFREGAETPSTLPCAPVFKS